MHSAVTWASLFGVALIIAGLAITGVGVLAIFAGGMSDAPVDGASVSSMGCGFALDGIALLALGIWLVC